MISALKLPALGVASVLLLASPALSQSVPSNAVSYTVKIRAAVEQPFTGDNKGTSSGSGFIIDRSRGWIATNAHVARRSPSTVRVSFKDEPYVLAKKVYVDAHLDLAILAVPQSAIPDWATEANFNCASEPEPGSSVVAFGHPWGLDYTATRGIVSGTKFRWGTEYLQTDAALNPGNSGGPLIDEKSGQVIGINTSGLASSGGIAFAVPAPLACTVIKLLAQGKNPAPPRLPVVFASTNRERELVVATVEGEWANALRPGDRIEAVNGDRKATYPTRVLDKTRGQTEISLAIRRGKERLTATLPVPDAKDLIERKGLLVSGMLLAKSVIPTVDQSITFVHFVDPASPADQAEFREGDEILSISGMPVKSFEEIEKALGDIDEKELEFVFRRKRAAASAVYDHYARRLTISNVKLVQ